MRFVPVKSSEQQAALSVHRTRDLLVKLRTQLINMIRGLLAEFGIDIPKGLRTGVADSAADRQWQSTGCADRSCQDRRYTVTARARHPRSAPRDRPRSGRLATWQRCCTSSHDDPRYRADRRDGSCSIGYRSASVPLGAAIRCLVGTDATSEVERWQRAARSYHQDGRQISAQAARCRHDGACASCKAKSRRRSTAGGSACAKAHKGRHRRDGEQDRADHLGDHDTWRDISCRSPTGSGGINSGIRLS